MRNRRRASHADGAGRRVVAAILLGGLIAGTIDLAAASLISGASPILVMHAVAGGLIGQAARGGGTPVAALGFLLQWAMSLIIAAIYVVASLRIPMLRRRWALGGLAYGVAVFLVMNYVVVPLSAVGHAFRFTPRSFALNLAAMLLFGLIVAAFARRRLGAQAG